MVTEPKDYVLCTEEESDYRIEKLDGWLHFIPAENRLARSLVRKHYRFGGEQQGIRSLHCIAPAMYPALESEGENARAF